MFRHSMIFLSIALLSACGGGGNGADNPPISTPPMTAPIGPVEPEPSQWQVGVFEPSENFANRCENVRTGVDVNGDPFPDRAGSLFEEKMFLRSWSDETYLWYDEIEDTDPNNFATPQAYFDVLVTNELTDSGARKDNFHFFQSTEEYEAFSQSGVQTGYGIQWAFVSSSPPREIRVVTVDANSSAQQAGVLRGYTLVEIDGEDVVNGDAVDLFNRAIFPSNNNESYDFTFRNTQGENITVVLTSGSFESQFVNNVRTIETASGRVGYVRFDGFQRPAQRELVDSFQQFVDENVTELVLDLRYNGGGLLAMSSQLGYMIAGPAQVRNRVFESLQFNDKHPVFNPVTGDRLQPTPFYDRFINWDIGVFTDERLPTLNLTRVFVITTGDTCSASESLINGLRGIDVEVIQIGNTTCGKPFGFYATPNCSTTYFTIQFQGVNDKGFGEFAEGFKPVTSPLFDDEVRGCVVNDDYDAALGTLDEDMLNEALFFMNNNECSTDALNNLDKSLAKQIRHRNTNGSLSVFDPRYRAWLLENKIYESISSPKPLQ